MLFTNYSELYTKENLEVKKEEMLEESLLFIYMLRYYHLILIVLKLKDSLCLGFQSITSFPLSIVHLNSVMSILMFAKFRLTSVITFKIMRVSRFSNFRLVQGSHPCMTVLILILHNYACL